VTPQFTPDTLIYQLGAVFFGFGELFGRSGAAETAENVFSIGFDLFVFSVLEGNVASSVG
jgi:hypothetical protein